ncbi:MAG: electron transfer flavoprotein subunit beta/FixA family protein [Deltaproteobacteria bacterium]|nr:MAG: electron transfer flavoprotein subunit beta/FixA family protein [Deltaproteobacteria bacterium]
MQLYVCVKHVPDTAATIKVSGEAEFNDAACKFIVNPYDEYALEAAVRLYEKEKTGEVVVVTVGPKAAVTTIRSALAMGAHRAIHVKHEGQFLDSKTTAAALKAAITSDGQPDLILGGKGAVDTEGFQTLYRLAAAMDVPVVNEVVKLDIGDGTAVVEKEIGGGTRQVLKMAIPGVIGATKGLNEPRYPKFPDIMKAKKKAIKEVDLSELDLGTVANTSKIVRLEAVAERSAAKIMQGELRDQVLELVDTLKNQEKVL